MALEWFEIVEGGMLEQGDLLFGLSVYVPSLRNPVQDDEECEVELFTYDLTILSQSCDLVEGQKNDVKQVLLCATFELKILQNIKGHKLANKNSRRQLCKFGLAGMHPLPAFQEEELSLPFSVISFNQTFSLPIEYVRSFAKKSGKRLRLVSPYKELLSQRFANSFCRIAIEEPLQLPE